MRIGLIGTHCAGKTTLINKLYSNILLEGYTFTQEPIRSIFSFGFPVNLEAKDPSQLAMCAIHLQNLCSTNAVFDRTLVDQYVYACYLSEKHGTVSSDVVHFIYDQMNKNINKYDYLFLCSPLPLKNDSFRSEDKAFQTDIHNLFLDVLALLNREYKNIYYLSGSVEERETFLLKTIGVQK